jgi:hypothetical protein
VATTRGTALLERGAAFKQWLERAANSAGVAARRGPQLLVHGRLNGESDVLVDQLTQRDSLQLVRCCWLPDTFVHGAFLRWPPCQGGRLVVHFTNRKNAPLRFFLTARDTSAGDRACVDLR